MRIYATSDIHGHLVEIPECDLLLIAGDICPVYGSHDPLKQWEWLNTDFRVWLDEIPAKHVVGIAGNHDFVFQRSVPLPKDLRWTYLEDSECSVDGLKIWGTPWQPWFYEWAFNAPRQDPNEVFLRQKWAAIPDDADIIVVHGPPYGYGDRVLYQGGHEDPHVGSKALNDAIVRVRPKAVVCGHIHPGSGAYRHAVDGTVVYNATLVNEEYEPVHSPLEVKL